MTGKKLLFLILALILPVVIFVFLKIFGRNEFNVPAMHQEGEIEAPENCHYIYATPYQIPDSISQSLKLNSGDSFYVIYFDPSAAGSMNRVTVELKDPIIKIISPADIRQTSIDVKLLKECFLLMKPPYSVVLIHRNKIRGYYDGADLDEMDRLIVELKIILKQY